MRTKRPHLLATLILLSTLLLNQCAPTESPKPKNPGVSSVVPEHWVQVSSSPPTFYPRGVSADCPTDYQSGDWVATEDAKGTLFFIPFSCPGPIPRQALVEEALSARSPRKLKKIKDENRKIRLEDVIDSAKSAPLIAVGTILTLGQCPDFLVGTKWKEEWKTSKKPH